MQNGDEDVSGRVFDADGTARGAAWRVNNATALPQRSPTVTATGDGGFIVAWHSEPGLASGEYGTIQAQYFDALGNPVRDEISVAQESTFRQSRPVIVAGHDGGFDIYWESDFGQSGATTDGILSRHFDVGGSDFKCSPGGLGADRRSGDR